jgi:hypothetical protein
MGAVYGSWAASAGIIMLLLGWLGSKVRRGAFGALIDSRGRYSLTQLQLVLWSVVVLSLVVGIFFGRVLAGASDPLNFTIPPAVLGLLGISVGSSVTSTVIKSGKDTAHPDAVAASDDRDPPFFWQVFTVEEGPLADSIIDVAKFQNFVVTGVLVVAYVALTVSYLHGLPGPDKITGLPTLPTAFLTLLGISHAGYLTGKLPNPGGTNPAGAIGAAGPAETASAPVTPPRRTPGLTMADLRVPDAHFISRRTGVAHPAAGEGPAAVAPTAVTTVPRRQGRLRRRRERTQPPGKPSPVVKNPT